MSVRTQSVSLYIVFRDKLLVYSNKEKLMRDPSTIPTFLRSVAWLDCDARMEAYDYLEKWAPPTNPEDMIELLRYEFAVSALSLNSKCSDLRALCIQNI